MIDTAQLQGIPLKVFDTIGEFSLPGGFIFAPSYLQAGLIVFLIFLLILTFAMLKHRYNHWAFKGIMPGIAFGFLLALLLETVLVIGGRTVFTEIIGWKNAPKPISNALEASRSHLVDVLGVTDTIPETKANEPLTIGDIMTDYKSLKESDKESLQSLICPM